MLCFFELCGSWIWKEKFLLQICNNSVPPCIFPWVKPPMTLTFCPPFAALCSIFSGSNNKRERKRLPIIYLSFLLRETTLKRKIQFLPSSAKIFFLSLRGERFIQQKRGFQLMMLAGHSKWEKSRKRLGDFRFSKEFFFFSCHTKGHESKRPLKPQNSRPSVHFIDENHSLSAAYFFHLLNWCFAKCGM